MATENVTIHQSAQVVVLVNDDGVCCYLCDDWCHLSVDCTGIISDDKNLVFSDHTSHKCTKFIEAEQMEKSGDFLLNSMNKLNTFKNMIISYY